MLNLSYDWFREEVPATIDRLAHLQVLDLSYNAFSGTLSSNLSSCVSLLVLSLSSNHIHGRIPSSSVTGSPTSRGSWWPTTSWRAPS
jgi:hypothetical protein